MEKEMFFKKMKEKSMDWNINFSVEQLEQFFSYM